MFQVPHGFRTQISVNTSTGTYTWLGREGELDLNYLCEWWLARKDSCKANDPVE